MTDIHQKLNTLYDLLIDNYKPLQTGLTALIADPGSIANTNKFATIIRKLQDPAYIEPLLVTISVSEKGDPWLTDFLYVASELLDEGSPDDEFEIPQGLLGKLGTWILNNKQEIAWMAATLLKYCESEEAENIQLKKLEERGDFWLTYAECVVGLIRYNEDKYLPLVKEISTDETRDENLRELCADIVKGIK